ncbi:MAG: hypothetical protein BMS9Abin17_0942 [Acidimicrobiia bacterium]|nr:MAG: hypothetical protein BMS9Abin17_0942 [Acidimicrobiia bacterium]
MEAGICAYTGRANGHTMPTMMRKLFGTLVGAAAILVISVPAFAAVSTMQLSSWTPEFSEGIMTGGTQTVTLTNVSGETLSNVSFSLDPVPCDCAVESYSASRGSLDVLDWAIDRLEPGATASLTVQYGDTTSVAAGNPATDLTIAGRIATAISIVLLLAAMVLARPGRFGVTAS